MRKEYKVERGHAEAEVTMKELMQSEDSPAQKVQKDTFILGQWIFPSPAHGAARLNLNLNLMHRSRPWCALRYSPLFNFSTFTRCFT